MRKKIILGLSLAHTLSISTFGLGPAFPESVEQPQAIVRMVDGGRKKRKRKMRMILSSKERNILDFLSGREKRKYVKELKMMKGVYLSKMDALVGELNYENLRKR